MSAVLHTLLLTALLATIPGDWPPIKRGPLIDPTPGGPAFVQLDVRFTLERRLRLSELVIREMPQTDSRRAG